MNNTDTYSIPLPKTSFLTKATAFSLFLTNQDSRHRINEASTAVASPKQAIKAKDQRRLDICAIKPITGGPNKNPRKPIVETAASATPGDMVFDLPAAPYTKGTTEETPIPTNKNPMTEGTI